MISAERRTTTAARLQAIFGDVDEVDAFTGMVSEPHVAGTEFGELQLAMWTRQFTALRDGDRFFYENDLALDAIGSEFGIDFRTSLADLIVANTDVDPDDVADNVFLLAAAVDTAPSTDTQPSAEPADATADDGTPSDDRVPADERRRGPAGDERPTAEAGPVVATHERGAVESSRTGKYVPGV